MKIEINGELKNVTSKDIILKVISNMGLLRVQDMLLSLWETQ